MWIFGIKDQNIGQYGESLAVRFLRKKGYKILERNWYNTAGKRLGEIDIVAQTKDREIVFVEVKTRDISGAMSVILPEEQITYAKMHKLERIAECYIKEQNLWDRSWHFDAIAIMIKDAKVYKIRHVKNIYF
jgi:putative endonuclease